MKKRRPGKVLMSRSGDFSAKLRYKKLTVVLKVKLDTKSATKYFLQREQVALSLLRGLAVPKRVVVPHKFVKKIYGQPRFCHSATEFIPWRGCFQRRFTTVEALGLWAFVVEQLCAFRRRHVLYADMKHVHVRVSDDKAQAKIIDFDGCVMVEPSDHYPRDAFPFTPQLTPPEFFFKDYHGENVVVYQAAMLLGQFLTKSFHNSDIHRSWPKLRTKLRKAGQERLYELMRRCLSFKPSERPKTLEVLYSKLRSYSLPPGSYRLWTQLRSPYVRELSKLELEGPGKNQSNPHLKAA